MKHKKTILITTDIALYPADSGCRVRIINLIKSLRHLGFSVVLITSEIPKMGARFKHKMLVDKLITVDSRGFGTGSPFNFDCSPFCNAVEKAVAEFDPTAVIAEYIWMAPCLDKVTNKAIKMIDTHDVMHVRKDSEAWVTCSKEEEAGLLRKANVIIAIQKNEKKKFGEMVLDRKVICVPHYFNVKQIKGRSKKDVIAFIGGQNPPNRRGIKSFLSVSWPIIKKEYPEAEFRIYGNVARYIPEGYEGVSKMGFIKKLEKAHKAAKVIINPVAIGTGLKIKNVEALCFGNALVTTSCGADGLEEGAGKAFIVEDDMGRFGKAVVKLLKDNFYRESLEKNALEFAKKNFNRKAVFKEFLEVLNKNEENS